MIILLFLVSFLAFALIAKSPIDPLTAYVGTESTLSDEAKQQIPALEDELKIMLLPKDPNDSKNVIIEIRGGAGGASVHINAGNNLLRQKKEADNSTNAGTNSVSGTGGGSMNVNLPVTHIPDNPGAAAKGTKDAQAIADAALSSVAGAITEALAGENSNGISLSSLNEAYNAGKSIFDSSSAIMANPSQPHTSERLTIAAGLVRLVQGTGKLQGVSVSSSESFTRNAGIISSALQNNSEASELRSVLDALSGSNTGSVSASGSNNRSFFDMIIEEIKKAFSGGNENVSSKTLASSSSVMDFLGNFVMDQAV